MNNLENIYTKNSLCLMDMDTAQEDDDDGWDFTFFYKAFMIVFDNFKILRSEGYPDSYFVFDLYDDRKLKDDFSNINTVFSKSLTEYIDNWYFNLKGFKLSLSNKNNIEYFLKTAFELESINEKLKKAGKNKKDYITIRKFCLENKINEKKLKNILIKNGYYNSDFSCMPTRKSMDREKVFITNYFMPYSKKINQKYTGRFYILWEYQFLRNMMLKHYKECEKDSYEYYIRYRQPKTYNTLIKRIINIIYCFYSLDLSIDGNFELKSEFSQFEWEDLAWDFEISYLHEYLNGKFISYNYFKYFEDKVNKIVLDNIKGIVNESLKLEVIEHLKIFNKYAKHYKNKYDKENTTLPENPNYHPLKVDKYGNEYYSFYN